MRSGVVRKLIFMTHAMKRKKSSRRFYNCLK